MRLSLNLEIDIDEPYDGMPEGEVRARLRHGLEHGPACINRIIVTGDRTFVGSDRMGRAIEHVLVSEDAIGFVLKCVRSWKIGMSEADKAREARERVESMVRVERL